jgi:pilus assembly protein Flp/PilA
VIKTITNNTANSGVVKQESPEWVHSASAEFFLAGFSFLPQCCVCPSRDYIQRGSGMTKFANSIKKFIVSEDGPTAVEYAVMLALIVVVCLAAISTLGESANSKFEEIGNYLT